MAQSHSFFCIATRRSVMTRAAKIASIVGTVLILINHSDTIMMNKGDWTTLLKCMLTFAVPYCVSTYSSVMAIREFETPEPA